MTTPMTSTSTSEALIALALAEGAISDADAQRLRGHVVKRLVGVADESGEVIDTRENSRRRR